MGEQLKSKAAQKRQERTDKAVARLAEKGWLGDIKKASSRDMRELILKAEARNARRG